VAVTVTSPEPSVAMATPTCKLVGFTSGSEDSQLLKENTDNAMKNSIGNEVSLVRNRISIYFTCNIRCARNPFMSNIFKETITLLKCYRCLFHVEEEASDYRNLVS